ncbi:hypothetical protein CYMTET_6358 [Cymbomonas tetramitiformis]|uniref:Uncharacterized protein n=1 Tax=Cymbomonas tetramitiformis TaxID=36881 RepID=A0AAE0LHZ7_9CHLO|nr:hypothetical protein CYMTET_6358 [Cymbomonas tetramitiformis]
MVLFAVEPRTRSAAAAFGVIEPGNGTSPITLTRRTRRTTGGGRQRHRHSARCDGQGEAQGRHEREPLTQTQVKPHTVTNTGTERTNGPAVTQDIQPTEEDRLLSEEFVFCDAVASGEGANDDADNDKDADQMESVRGNTRKNALLWREVGRHSTDLENAAFLAELSAKDACGK